MIKYDKNTRYAYLDILRIFAVFFVMYGHLVTVGGRAKSLGNIINSSTPLPLVDPSGKAFFALDEILGGILSAPTANIGVMLFFITTGYLMPMMMDRYSRSEFIINRFFRIYPALVVSIILVGFVLWLFQDITFSFTSYLSSVFLIYGYLKVDAVTGVLWTLAIEVIFYIISFTFGPLSIKKLLTVQLFLYFLMSLDDCFKGINLFNDIAFQARYIVFITVGSSVFIAEKEITIWRKCLPVVWSAAIAYGAFKYQPAITSSGGHKMYETYWTHVITLCIFFVFYFSNKFILFRRLAKSVKFLSDCVYPIYLLHITVGMCTMASVRGISTNPYFVLGTGVAATIFLSWVMHALIEKPGIDFARRLIAARRVRRSKFDVGDTKTLAT